ncbi:rhomboid family intramembrane serine protease [Parvularcula flava]|uniref:Rhomboid family intramembrane serine protease n=1 Tax=Aquisalinus luteolus TaxID=1566827 RepID=A0A8J3A0S5_9PROT|nr:rhomboid family intramembrane serine protease [Aquisalinus luteolus]NHK26957.1 rhomboid family intramembrane serine protease [Aquisalinus luteolus]GGH93929.1 rhomboid family intramembrane serine protease [Aquisalinus luteolus]
MGFVTSAPAVFILIAINVVVSLYALYVDQKFLNRCLFSIQRLRRNGEWYRLITASFLHGSILHLLVNMYVLFMFGVAVERELGTTDFLIVYFGSQLAAKGVSLMLNWNKPQYSSLGASGAVSGVLLSYCTFAPFSMLYFLGVVPVPAIAVAVIYILYSRIVMNRKSNVAHEAHLGGAIGGIVLTILLHPELLPF